MNRKMCDAFVWALSVSLAALAGCDTSPNPGFEQALKDQQATQAGDIYAALSSLPRQDKYLRAEGNLRQAYASQQALSIRSSYESMLKKLDAEPDVGAAGDLLASCRASFNEVVAFHANESIEAQKAAAAAAATFDRLNACRDGAIAAGKSGEDSAKTAAELLRRFASTGMVLVGITTIARGDETAGLGLWRRADALVQEDRPDFKLRPQHLLNR